MAAKMLHLCAFRACVVLALVCSTCAEGAVIPSLRSSGRVAPVCASDAHVLSPHGFFGSRVAVEEEAATGAASHDHVLREAFDVRRQLMQQSADLVRKTADLTRKTADWMEVGVVGMTRQGLEVGVVGMVGLSEWLWNRMEGFE